MSENRDRIATEAALLDRARAIAPLIATEAPQIERRGELTKPVLDVLFDAGLFRMALPRSLGGHEISPAGVFAVVEEIARADASTAWCVGQGCGCSMAGAFLEPRVAEEIFGDPRAVMASGPPGRISKAVRGAGGYRVTGRWVLGSGIRHSTWIGGHAPVIDSDGKPVMGEDGKQIVRTMMFPRTAAEVIANWNVVGLRGTGSDDYAVRDLAVAEDYTFTRESRADRRVMAPLYEFTGLNMFGIGFAAVSLGLARAALDELAELAGAKMPTGQTRLLRDAPITQFQVGHAEARLRSSRAFIIDAMHKAYDCACRKGNVRRDERVELRMATTWAIQQGRDVVDVAYNMGGASSLYVGTGIERRFRDAHTVTQHVQAGLHVFEFLGQSLLGLPAQSNLL